MSSESCKGQAAAGEQQWLMRPTFDSRSWNDVGWQVDNAPREHEHPLRKDKIETEIIPLSKVT